VNRSGNGTWSIKEAVFIFLIYFFLWIMITFPLSKVMPEMPFVIRSLADGVTSFGSLSLLFVCLIWLSLVKKGSLGAIGIVKCKLVHYLYAFVCAVSVCFVLKVLFEPFLVTYVAPSSNEGNSALKVLNLVVFVPVAEEVYFRGILFSACKNKVGLPSAAIVSALLFGLVHFRFHYPALWFISGLPPVIYGLVLALVFHYSKSLFPAILCHSMINLLTLLG